MAKALQLAGEKVTIISTSLGAEGKVATDTWLDTAYGRVIYTSALFHSLPGAMLAAISRAVPGCDVVHLNSIFYPPSLFSALLAARYKKPIVWSPRGELDEKALVYSTWKKRPVLWFIRRFLIKKIVFHTTSPEESERVRLIFGVNAGIVEIPNYMEIPEMVDVAAPRPYLLSIGRIHPKKALENLIAALPLSNGFMRSGFVLKIAGDNQNAYGDQLKKLVGELGLEQKVIFAGAVEGNVKQGLYAGAYFSILPSHTENFGNVVIESLAQGTPVIASKGTPWQILQSEKAGVWEENTPAALARAIDESILFPADLYLQYRQNARKLALGRFDINANLDVWVRIYRNVCGQ